MAFPYPTTHRPYDPSMTRGYVIMYHGVRGRRAWLGPEQPKRGTLQLHDRVRVYPSTHHALAVLREAGLYTDIRYRITTVAKARKALRAQASAARAASTKEIIPA